MAFPVIPEKYLDKFPSGEAKQKVKDNVVVAASKVSNGFANILDFIIVLTAAFWYFFFTGMAILLKREIPKEWLKLGTHLGMARVSSVIRKAPQKALQKVAGTKKAAKKTFKVVEIDTKRPMKILKSSK